MAKKKYTLRQTIRKSKARTKGIDARIARLVERVALITKRSKLDKPLTKAELRLIATLRDVLAGRLEVAAQDAALHDFEKRLDAGEITE